MSFGFGSTYQGGRCCLAIAVHEVFPGLHLARVELPGLELCQAWVAQPDFRFDFSEPLFEKNWFMAPIP